MSCLFIFLLFFFFFFMQKTAYEMRISDGSSDVCSSDLSTRDVTAGAVQRQVLVTEDDARQRLDFDIFHRVTLDLSEISNLRLREFDILQVLPGELIETILFLAWRQSVALTVPSVELDR